MPMSLSADRGKSSGGARNPQGQRVVKCALHKGLQDFK